MSTEYKLKYTAAEIDEKLEKVDELAVQKTLLYEEQTLTDEQKAQVRSNIGVEESQVQSDWDQTDETAADYLKNKPDENDALTIVAEMGLVEPVAAKDGSVYTDENGVVYTL